MLAIVSLNSCIDRTLEADGFQVGQHCQARLVSERPAGKGVNVARILGQLKVACSLYGFVGAEAAGRFQECLAGLPVAYRLQARPCRTRVNTTIIDPRAGTETHVRELGETVSAAEFQAFVRSLRTDMTLGDWVIFCGSLPPGVSADAFGGLVRDLVTLPARVAVDAAGAPLAAAVRSGCHLVKPNREEFADLVGGDAVAVRGIPAAARLLRQRESLTALTCLVSDGANGAFALEAHGEWQAQAAESPAVKNTVGAGDALLAGFLWGLSLGEPTPSCLERAVRVASASLACLQAGEVDPTGLRARVRVEEVEGGS
jgi:1-phosphofructokinase family hexose kinase